MGSEVVKQQWNSSWTFSTVTGCTRQLRGCSILLFCTLDLGQLNRIWQLNPSVEPQPTEVPTQCWSTLGECFCPSCLEDPTVPQAVNSGRFPARQIKARLPNMHWLGHVRSLALVSSTCFTNLESTTWFHHVCILNAWATILNNTVTL